MSDRRAQPFHFKNLQEDFGHLWNGHHCTESPVNQNQTFVEASVFRPKGDGSWHSVGQHKCSQVPG